MSSNMNKINWRQSP